jgi:hypothetical protein
MNSLLELDREAAERVLEALEDALPQLFAEDQGGL